MSATQYTRPDGSTYIVARTTAGTYVVIGVPGSYRLKRDAVAAGK